jgi:hypothetical protein
VLSPFGIEVTPASWLRLNMSFSFSSPFLIYVNLIYLLITFVSLPPPRVSSLHLPSRRAGARRSRLSDHSGLEIDMSLSIHPRGIGRPLQSTGGHISPSTTKSHHKKLLKLKVTPSIRTNAVNVPVAVYLGR